VLTGAQIENVLIDWAASSIQKTPEDFSFAELEEMCRNQQQDTPSIRIAA
jgi:hypothetical protein